MYIITFISTLGIAPWTAGRCIERLRGASGARAASQIEVVRLRCQ